MRILSINLLTLIYFLPFQAGITNGAPASSRSIPLPQALTHALQNNPSIALAGVDIEIAKNQIKESNFGREGALPAAQKEIQLLATKVGKAKSANLIEKQIYSYYFETVLGNERVGLAKLDLQVAKESYVFANDRYKSGISDKISLAKAGENVQLKRQALLDSEQQKEISYLNFLLAYDPSLKALRTKSVYPSDSIKILGFTPNLEADLRAASQNNLDILLAKKRLSTAQIELSSTQRGQMPVVRIKEAELNNRRAELNLKDIGSKIYVDLTRKHLKLRTFSNKLRTTAQQLKVAETDLNNSQLKYRAGLVGKEEVSIKKYILEAMRVQYLSTIVEYNLTLVDYKQIFDNSAINL